MSIESLSLSIIKYIDDILLSLGNCVEHFGSSSTPDVLVDKLPYIKQCVKEIDRTIAVLPQNMQSLYSEYNTLFNTLSSNRNDLICKINEREAKNIQMNTMGDMYSDDNILDEISIALDDVYASNLSNVRIDPIIDPHEYSVLGVINKFQNEKMLLSDLNKLISDTLNEFGELINTFKQNILNVKSMIDDGEVIEKLLENDTETYNQILNNINGCTVRLNQYRNKTKLMFRIYKSLVSNYGIYSEAVNKYTSLALECFFNKDSDVELC